jgi:hypothetical protein
VATKEIVWHSTEFVVGAPRSLEVEDAVADRSVGKGAGLSDADADDKFKVIGSWPAVVSEISDAVDAVSTDESDGAALGKGSDGTGGDVLRGSTEAVLIDTASPGRGVGESSSVMVVGKFTVASDAFVDDATEVNISWPVIVSEVPDVMPVKEPDDAAVGRGSIELGDDVTKGSAERMLAGAASPETAVSVLEASVTVADSASDAEALEINERVSKRQTSLVLYVPVELVAPDDGLVVTGGVVFEEVIASFPVPEVIPSVEEG